MEGHYLNGDVDFLNGQDLTKILRVDFDHEAAFASVVDICQLSVAKNEKDG